MKIGRNELCPCGSGKKFKHCCLNSNTNINFSNEKNIPSPYGNDFIVCDTKSLIIIFEEYEYLDLCRAVFAINSFIMNRCLYSFSLTLNYCLTTTNKHGLKQIKNYKEFKIFFERIKQFYKKTYQDVLCDDFGEIKINILNKFYKVIIGTGFNNTYPFYILSAELINFIDEKEDIIKAFEFIDKMINELQSYNYCSHRYDKQKLHLPSENYFLSVYEYYKTPNFNTNQELWHKVFNTKYIEQQHFVYKNDNAFLLFNTSFLIDFIAYYIEKIDEIKLQHYIDMSLSRILYDNYDMSLKNLKVMSPIMVSFSNDGQKFINATSFIEDNQKSILLLSSKYLKENKIEQSYKKKIIEELSNGNLHIFMPHKNKLVKGRMIDNNTDIQFIEYGNHINLRKQGFILIKDTNKDEIPILDLIHIIVRTENIEELYEFLEFLKTTKLQFINMFSGICNIYEMWKTCNHQIEQGAISFGIVMPEVYLEDYNIKDLYQTDYKSFPFQPNNLLFSAPYQWNIQKIKDNYYSYKNNSIDGFGGYLCILNKLKIFLSHNAELYGPKIDVKQINFSKIFDDLLFELFHTYKNVISKNIDNNYIYQIINIPFNNKNSHKLKELTNYVYIDYNVFNNIYRLKIAIDYEILFRLLENSSNRKQEIELLKLVLKSLNFGKDLNCSKFNTETKKAKVSALTSYECPYIKNDICLTRWPSSLTNAKTKKKLAILCKNINIKPGKYKADKALKNIRDIQELFQSSIENLMIDKDKISLHKKFLSILAQLEHKKKICNIKYKLASNSKKDKEALELIGNREDTKEQIRFLHYLIETNLCCIHNTRPNKNISDKEIEDLLSYGEWFVNLQDTGDKIKWKFEESILNIDYDYTIGSLSKKTLKVSDLNKLNERNYKNIDYIPDTITNNSFEKLSLSLTEDLGFSFKALFQILDYLKREFSFSFKDSCEIDVYQINKKELLSDLESILTTHSDIYDITKALEYLILNEANIKIVYSKGIPVQQGLIPIWERENRIDRFEIKPIIEVGQDIIFSPPVIYSLFERWLGAIESFYPPYEHGLSNYLKEIKLIQKQCQTELENAILKLCQTYKSSSDFCDKSVYLSKRFPNEKYPDNLGDYDCLFIDTKNKIIWNLESKFLQYVGSISEFSKHQDSFYNKNKKDIKFSNRIVFLIENYKNVLSSLNIPIEEYTIKSYMVTNKVFVSFFKEVSFDIITYYELEQMLKKFYGQT